MSAFLPDATTYLQMHDGATPTGAANIQEKWAIYKKGVLLTTRSTPEKALTLVAATQPRLCHGYNEIEGKCFLPKHSPMAKIFQLCGKFNISHFF